MLGFGDKSDEDALPLPHMRAPNLVITLPVPDRTRLPGESGSVSRQAHPRTGQCNRRGHPGGLPQGRGVEQAALPRLVHGGGARVEDADGVWPC